MCGLFAFFGGVNLGEIYFQIQTKKINALL